MDKRSSERYKMRRLKGKLYQANTFHVNNISMEGINLVCGFQPQIGVDYTVHLINNGSETEFEINVTRAEVQPFKKTGAESPSMGLMYSVGARFINNTTSRANYIKQLIGQKKSYDGILYNKTF